MRVSMAEIVRVDPWAFVPSLLAGFCWLMMLLGSVAGPLAGLPLDGFGKAAAFSLGVTGLAWIVAGLRARRAEAILASGERVPARVERYWSHEFWAFASVAYELRGTPFRRNVCLVAGRRARAVGAREAVTVVLPAGAPHRPLILELFGAGAEPGSAEAARAARAP